mgnify:CR=1 FL=1
MCAVGQFRKPIWGGGRSWGTPGALLEAKTTKKLPKRYVYSEIWVFGERRTPKRSDEPDDIPFVSFDGKRKKTKKPTRLISTTLSISFAGTKSRVRTLDAPELRLSMFQRSRRANGPHIRPPEKTIERAIEGISSYGIDLHQTVCFIRFGGNWVARTLVLEGVPSQNVSHSNILIGFAYKTDLILMIFTFWHPRAPKSTFFPI